MLKEESSYEGRSLHDLGNLLGGGPVNEVRPTTARRSRRRRAQQIQGMFANMGVGTPHSFRNESGRPAKMLISVAPAGLEEMFFECGIPLAPDATTTPPPTKAEIEKLVEIAPRYGIEIRLPEH